MEGLFTFSRNIIFKLRAGEHQNNRIGNINPAYICFSQYCVKKKGLKKITCPPKDNSLLKRLSDSRIFEYNTRHLNTTEDLPVDWNLSCLFQLQSCDIPFSSLFHVSLSTQKAIPDKQINVWDSSPSLFCAALPASRSQLDLLGGANRLVVSWAPLHKL